jgi:hypothetical protein
MSFQFAHKYERNVFMFSIYKHTCPNGKIYIGITNQEPEKRWCNGFGYQKNRRFFSDIVAYGWNNFLHEIIAQVETQEEATRVEKILIASHKTTNTEYGYNLQGGILAQCVLHNDTCTNTLAQNTIHNGSCTNDIPQKRIDRRGGIKFKVAQYDRDGNLIATFNSMKDASIFTGVNSGDICSCCKGHKADGTPKHTAGGFIWKYANEVG